MRIYVKFDSTDESWTPYDVVSLRVSPYHPVLKLDLEDGLTITEEDEDKGES